MAEPKVAIVHDWMVSPGGAERVVLALHKLYPKAPVYTAAYSPEKFPEFANVDVRPTWLNKFGIVKRRHQLFPLLRALAFRMLDLSDYDIVISSCSAESKYVRTGKALHICYCHTPIRYYWSDYDWYLHRFPIRWLRPFVRVFLPLIIRPLRFMDFKFAQGVDEYVANSQFVADRIKRYYKRDAIVINPPIDVEKFTTKTKSGGEYFLIVGRQVAYKRLDVAVDAFNKLGLPLWVSGTGEEIAVQKARAKDNIKFLGRVPDADLPELYRGAKAFIFPAIEDFGIVPVEAQANGTPVIAYRAGGALETIIEGQTGEFFDEQTGESLAEAVRNFDESKYDPKKIREHAERYNEARFLTEIKAFIDQSFAKRKN